MGPTLQFKHFSTRPASSMTLYGKYCTERASPCEGGGVKVRVGWGGHSWGGEGGGGAQRHLTADYTLAAISTPPQHKQIPYTQPSDVYSFIATILVKLG